MSEDKPKKTKIDLKARLGKTTVSAGSPGGDAGPASIRPGSIPPPPVSIAPPSAITRGIAPPPGIMPSIAPAPPPQPRPTAPPPTAAQQTIKVEVGEEMHAERRKASARAALVGVIMAVIGGGVGFFVGGTKATGDAKKVAIQGASKLEKSVSEANARAEALRDKLKEGVEQLQEQKFPTDLVKELPNLIIPFDAMALEGARVGDLPARVQKMIFKYLTDVETANKQKDRLRTTLSLADEPVKKIWAAAKEPVVNFSVVFRKQGQKGYVAELVPNSEPFPVGKDWPNQYKVKATEKGKEAEVQASRLLPDDAQTAAPKPAAGAAAPTLVTLKQLDSALGNSTVVLPVEPSSTARLSSDQVVFQVRSAFRDLQRLLAGSQDDPSNPSLGLVEDGKALAEELKKISAAR
jgi:hypothetical protein